MLLEQAPELNLENEIAEGESSCFLSAAADFRANLLAGVRAQFVRGFVQRQEAKQIKHRPSELISFFIQF